MNTVPSITQEEADTLLETLKKRYMESDPLEEGEDFTKLLKHFTQNDLSQELGISRGYIGQRCRIYRKLIPELKKYLSEDRILYWEAYTLSGLTEEKQREIYNKKKSIIENLIPALRTEYEEGNIPQDVAYNLSEKPEIEQEKEYDRLFPELNGEE